MRRRKRSSTTRRAHRQSCGKTWNIRESRDGHSVHDRTRPRTELVRFDSEDGINKPILRREFLLAAGAAAVAVPAASYVSPVRAATAASKPGNQATCAGRICCGIGRIGWHTFRHTFRTLLDETGAPMKVQQELIRHADIRTTMNVYGKAMDESKRAAHGKVVRLVLPSKVA
jgi:integrase-like protein